MYERRRQAASPVSLLAVTFVFVWACSSGGHNEDNSVTASGGAGSDVAVGSGPSTDGGAPFEDGASNDAGSAPSLNVGGAGGDELDPEPTSGAGSMPHAGAGSTQAGGSAPESRAGSESGGGESATVAGATASAGAGSAGAPPVIVEPTCEATGNTSTEGLFLPCDVSAAFFVCRNCHSNPPVKAVNHAYVTFQDIKPMAGEIYGVIKSGYMPWPPYTITPYARNVLLKWLGKDGTCAVGVAQGCQ